MATDYENFDLKPPRTGPDPVMITLSVALVLVLGGLAFLGFANKRAKSDVQTLQQKVASLTQQVAAKESDMEALIADHEAEKARMNQEWQEQLKRTEAANEERLQKTYATISSIVNESGTTKDYMHTLEQKVKNGKQLQQEEIEQMRAVAGGLAYLYAQYEKPIHEFRELDAYLTEQMQMDRVPPAERAPLLKRIFTPNYREGYQEQMAAYYQDQGRIDALENTQTRVSQAYSSAQAEMAQIKLNAKKYMDDLEKIIVAKEGNMEAVNSFFDVSAKILEIHQKVMDVEIPEVEPDSPTIRP